MAASRENPGKTTLYTGIGVMLLLAVAVAIASARGPVPEQSAEPPAAPAAGEQEPGGAETPPADAGEAATGTPAPDAPKGGAQSGAGKPAPSERSGEPVAPAAAGSALTTLPAPPDRTIGMLKVPEGFTKATYDIVLEPYGWGPSGAEGGRLVAHIVSAKGTDDGASALAKDFAGRNATIWVQGPLIDGVKLGGSYSGKMEVRLRGDVGVLYLVEATPSKK